MWKYGQSAFATSRAFFRATFDNGLPWFRSSRSFAIAVRLACSEKEITTNRLRWPRAVHQKKQPKIRQVEDSCPSPTKMLTDLSKLKPTKHSKKDAQRRSIDEVVFAKWKRNKTTPRHTVARIRRLPQQISIVCEKSDKYEPTTFRGIIASVERYLRNLRYSESVIERQRLTVELFERHLFKRICQFWHETVDQFVCRLRQLTASSDFAEFQDDYIRVNRFLLFQLFTSQV